MKTSILSITASEDRGGVRDNATSRTMFGLALSLSASVFLLASSAEANTAKMAIIRDVETPLDVQREQSKVISALDARHNEFSYTRKGDELTIQFR